MKDVDELLKKANESIEVDYIDPEITLKKAESIEKKPFWTKPKKIGIGVLALASITAGIAIPLSMNNNGVVPNYITVLRARADAGEFKYSEQTQEFDSFVNKINTYASPLFESLNKDLNTEKKNAAYSPASIFYALSMLSKITQNDDKAKLLSVLGVSENDLNAYLPSLFRACNRTYAIEKKTIGKERIDNSIWLDDKYDFNPDTLDDLADVFYSNCYSGDFDKDNAKMNTALSDYVNKSTEGLLRPNYKFDRTTAFVLLNTLFFEDVWNREGLPLSKAGTRKFTQFGDVEVDADYYRSYYSTGKIHETDKYRSMYARTYNGFSIDFMVPKTGVSVDELFQNEVLREHEENTYVYEERVEEDGNPTSVRYLANIEFPEFEAGFDKDILDCFQNTYGIISISDFGDFVKAKDHVADGFYISSIIHTTKVEVKKDTIKGAAATAIGGNEATSMPVKEIRETLVVDHSFVYSIKDPQGIKLFEGIVYKV